MLGLASILLLLVAWLALLACRGEFAVRVVIIGTGPLANRLVAEMNGRRRLRYRVAAIVEDPGLVDGSLTGLLAGPLTRLGPIIPQPRPAPLLLPPPHPPRPPPIP